MGFEIKSGADRPTFADTPFGNATVLGINLGYRNIQVEHQNILLITNYLVLTHFGTTKLLIKEISGGVEMEDIVDYSSTLGILGQFVHPLVKPKLDEISHTERS
jgi:hypothetical protein